MRSVDLRKKAGIEMKSVQKNFTALVAVFLMLSGAQAWSAPIAQILRAGAGRVHMAYAWPDAYKIPAPNAEKKYSVRRLQTSEYPSVSPAVRASWDPRYFTDLSTLAVGTELEEFQVVVHGLELKDLQKGLNYMSFDDFIARQLNPSVPTGIDFVRFYPYFFHKKTVISASIVNAFNTATFGDSGFILTVPSQNYLGCSTVDMHTPTDRDFYPVASPFEKGAARSAVAVEAKAPAAAAGGASASASMKPPAAGLSLAEMFSSHVGYSEPHGPVAMRELYTAHPLVSLPDFLPKSKVETGGTPFRKRVGFEADSGDDALIKLLIKAMGGTDQEELMGRVGTQSWYNEIAISPVSPQGNSVEISGIFVRTSNAADALAATLAKPEVRILLELAEVYNLPVLHIYDGQYYETDVGE